LEYKHLKSAVNLAPVETTAKIGKWEWDLENGTINWSDDLFRIFGLEPQSFIPTLDRGLAVIYADDKETAETAYHKAITYGEEYCIEKRIVKPDGGIVVVLSIGTVLKDQQGKIIRLLDIFQDITETKKIAVTLEQTVADIADIKARNELLETVIESIPIGIAVNKIDDGKATLVNKRFRATYGWREEDFTDVETFFNKIYPDEAYRNEITTQVISDILSGDPKRMKWDNISVTTTTGEKRVINAKNIPLFDQNLMISTVIDVTQTATQAAELHRIKTNQEALINGTEDLIWSVDKNLRIITSNKAYGEMIKMVTGREPQEGDFVMTEEFGGELNKKWETYYQRALNGERFEVREQVFHLLRQRMEYALITFNPMFNERGELFGAACYSKDITVETDNLKALEKTKAELEKIMDYSLDMICRVDADSTILSVSAAAKTILGYAPDELIGRHLFDFIYQEDLEKTAGMAARVMAGEEMIHNENRYIRKDGSLVYLTWSARWDPKDQIRYGIARDATEKKKSEADLLESEKKYKYLFEHNPLPILMWDFETLQIVDCNQEAVNTYGYTREEFLQLTTKQLRPDEDVPLLEDAIKTEESYGEPHHRTWRHKKKNGEIMYMEVTGHLINYNGRKVSLALSHDITERKKTEQALEGAYSEKNTILESIGDAFFAIDRNWIVTYWNNHAERVLMVAKDAILGHNLWEVFSDSVNSESYKNYHKAIETNQVIHFEDHYAPLNSWYEISAYPSDNGLSVYFKDITERKASEMRLTKLNEDLQKQTKELAISNAELEQFAYVASHDLQEPLRMVTSFLSQLEKKYSDVIDDKGRQYIHFAVDGAKRMRQIILDLLDFSRVGRMEEDPEEVDFNKLLNEILALYRRQIEELNAKISFEKLPLVQTYKTPLRQVFQNLIGNSLKYHKQDGIPEIKISCKETKTHFQFSVQDNGIGIAPEYFEKIFIIFQRLHNKDEYSGTGMGLAITKKIIENLGGKIWIESKEGKGSVFYFTLLKNHK